MRNSVLIAILFAGISISLQAQDYCNYPDDCLFWQVQLEQVLSETDIIYSLNVKQFDNICLTSVNSKLNIYSPDIPQGEVRACIFFNYISFLI